MYLVVYNGLAQSRTSNIHLPVQSKASYSVTKVGDPNFSMQEVLPIPAIDCDCQKYRVVFSTGELGPLSASIFKVTVATSIQEEVFGADSLHPVVDRRLASGDITGSNEYYSATFDRYVRR